MLEFNPHFRISAEEALANPIFDKIRQEHFEKPSPIKIKQSIFSIDAYDYELFQERKFTIQDLKKMLLTEIKKVRQNSILF